MTYSSHHGPPSYLELFFCQKVQILPPQGVSGMVWVVSGEDRSTCVEIPYGEYRNTLHFSVSEVQPEGEILVESLAPGEVKTDASCGMKINTETHWRRPGVSRPARVNDSIQRVISYRFTLPTPLNRSLGKSEYRFADHLKEWQYPHPLGFNNTALSELKEHRLTVDEDDLSVDSSGISDAMRMFIRGTVDVTRYYSLEQRRGDAVPYLANHWWIDNVDKWEPRKASVNAKLYWRTLTADSQQRKVNDSTYPYLPPVEEKPGKVSSETYFEKIEAIEERWYDTGWHGRRVTNVNVENVPNTSFQISYWVTKPNGRELVSQTTVPLPGRGWLPADTFGEEMHTCHIQNLGIGLLGLIANRRRGMVLDVLYELLHLWGKVYKNVKDGELNELGKGLLPDTFPRYGTKPVAGQRTVYANCWLGLGLCKAAEFLKREEEPPELKLLLRQIALFVSYNIDTATGMTSDGYTEEGFVLGSTSLKAEAMAGIFLNEYLQLEYDPLVHNRLCRVQERLHDDQSLDLEGQTWEEVFTNLSAYIAYLDFYGGSLYRQRATQLILKTQRLWSDMGTLTMAPTLLFAYTVSRGKYWLEDEEIRQDRWRVDSFLKVYEHHIAGFLQEPPHLVASAWHCIAWQELDIYLKGRFQSNFLEVSAYRDHCFLIMRSFWPFGYLTTSQEKEKKLGGVIGSLLFGLAEVHYHWFALFSLFRDGLDINQAQGWMLDEWGNSLGFPRLGLEPDYHYKRRLAREIKHRNCTLKGMQELLEDYFDKWYMEEGRPPDVYWVKVKEGENTIFKKEYWQADEDQILRINERDGVKGIYTEPKEESFRPLSFYTPKVRVETPVAIEKAVQTVKRVTPSGVPLELITLTGREDFSAIDTVYYLQDIEWGNVLSHQTLTYSDLEVAPGSVAIDNDDSEIVTSRQDINTIRLVYLPAGAKGWLEDGTEITNPNFDQVLVVPSGIEIEHGSNAVFGKVIVQDNAFIANYYGPLDISFYTRDGRVLRLEPTLRTLVIV